MYLQAILRRYLTRDGGKILESYELFDIYEGAQIKAGFKSLAYKLTFRAKDRTLEEADIAAAMKKIMNGLEASGHRAAPVESWCLY